MLSQKPRSDVSRPTARREAAEEYETRRRILARLIDQRAVAIRRPEVLPTSRIKAHPGLQAVQAQVPVSSTVANLSSTAGRSQGPTTSIRGARPAVAKAVRLRQTWSEKRNPLRVVVPFVPLAGHGPEPRMLTAERV